MYVLDNNQVTKISSMGPEYSPARDLPFDHSRYFELPTNAVLISMNILVTKHARVSGVNNAANFMRQAYEGEISKRAPVSVVPFRDGLFLVDDGNSTVLNAWSSGWPNIPCIVARAE